MLYAQAVEPQDSALEPARAVAPAPLCIYLLHIYEHTGNKGTPEQLGAVVSEYGDIIGYRPEHIGEYLGMPELAITLRRRILFFREMAVNMWLP